MILIYLVNQVIGYQVTKADKDKYYFNWIPLSNLEF